MMTWIPGIARKKVSMLRKAFQNQCDDILGFAQVLDDKLAAIAPSIPSFIHSGKTIALQQKFARRVEAIANNHFRKLLQPDTAGFDPLTTWYILVWDAFRARDGNDLFMRAWESRP
jgi:putative DNA methylase